MVSVCACALPLLSLANAQYGWFIDEFYYFACARRLAWGYVDQPPLSIFVLRLVVGLFGESLLAARGVASACGGATVFIAGVMAQRMGAARFGPEGGLRRLRMREPQALDPASQHLQLCRQYPGCVKETTELC